MKTKNLLKGLLSLSLLTVMVACGSNDSKVNALPTDKNETIGDTKMSEIYNELYDELGASAAFDKVLLKIAEKEVNMQVRANELYERINEKMKDLMESNTYTDYEDYTLDAEGKVVGEFDGEKLMNYLESQGYEITPETANDVNPAADDKCWDAAEVLKEGATVKNEYISKHYYPMVMKEMLNEEYIVAEQANRIKNGRYRTVEYVYIDFDTEKPEETLNRVYDFEETIKNSTEKVNLKELADAWKTHKKDELDYKAANINNPAVDKDKNFASTFTCSFTKDVETCLKSLKLSIDKTEYYSEPEFYSNSESTILNTQMRDIIFSSKVLDKTNEVYKHVYQAPDGSLYLKNSTSDSIVNIDSSNNRYYFVRIDVVNSDSLNTNKDAYDVELAYQAAEILRTNTSTTTASIVHYLEKYEVSFFDEDLYDYVQDTYNYPEEE